jgi:hypothetical protein
MTPQEKAEKLVYKMYDEMFYYKDGYSSNDAIGAAKKCALIAVDEVIKSQKNIFGLNNQATKFYLEVKHEIEKQ